MFVVCKTTRPDEVMMKSSSENSSPATEGQKRETKRECVVCVRVCRCSSLHLRTLVNPPASLFPPSHTHPVLPCPPAPTWVA